MNEERIPQEKCGMVSTWTKRKEKKKKTSNFVNAGNDVWNESEGN